MSVILDSPWPMCDHGYVSGGCAECRQAEWVEASSHPSYWSAMAPAEDVVSLLDDFTLLGFTYPGRYGL